MTTCLENVLTWNEQFAKPAVGMGATIVLATDRHACTIVAVSASGKTITLQRDNATRTDSFGMSESQRYEYAPDPSAPRFKARLTAKGWSNLGCKVLVGVRREYYDPCF